MKVGMSLKEWAATFDLTKEEEEVVGRHAQGLLNDDLFQRILSLMECQIVQQWNRCPLGAEEDLKAVKRQMEAVKLIRRTLKALATKTQLAKRETDS